MVGVTLLLITVTAGASGMEERILRGKMNYARMGYSMSLASQVEAGQLNASEVEGLLQAYNQEAIESFGLDKPWWGRLLPTLRMIVTFDLGETNTFTGTDVWGAISQAIPQTLMLLVASMGVSAPLGILLGASRARKAQTRGDLISSLMSTASFAIPGWLLGYLLLAVFIRAWYGGMRYFGGFISTSGASAIASVNPVFNLFYRWVLPLTSLAIPSLGFWYYQSRSILVNIAQEEYVTVAEAKGLSQRRVNLRYILRVGLPTILTQVGLVLHSTIANSVNSVPVEVIFGWHGLGHLLWRVAWSGGIQIYGSAGLLLGVVYAYALVYAVLRFTMEVLYVFLDPRIRY
jgi:ABC-type dipeptide/oligopeptide/nickel transport system permease component